MMLQPDHPGNRPGTSTRKTERRPRSDRRKAILAILLLTAGLLIAVALATYDITDESLSIGTKDLWGGLTGNADALVKADRVHNALGLTGALVSDVLIKSTLGYSAAVFPFLMILWGWAMLRRKDFGPVMLVTNYVLAGALLVSAAFGMSRIVFADAAPGTDWSGVVGDYVASLLTRLVGKIGGTVIVGVAMLITIVMAVDLDVHRTIERLHDLSLRMADWLSRIRDQWTDWRARNASEEDGDARNRGKTPGVVNVNRPPAEEDDDEDVGKAEEPRSKPEPLIRKMSEPALDRPHVSPSEKKPLPIAIARNDQLQDDEIALPAPVEQSAGEEIDYVFPSVDLLDAPRPGKENVDEAELKANADLLRDTLLEFDVEVVSVSVTPGPVVTLYELVPATGVKISRIVSLESDIALKLAAKGIRIIAPIPGKSAVGVEIPNSNRALVTVRSVINSSAFRDAGAALPLAMGKTIAGEVFVDDLSKMPHLLIAGSTGSGKSVGINTIIISLLYRMHPSELKLVLVDPKKIELAQYKLLRNHFLARSPEVDEEIVTTPHNSVMVLKGVEIEMERRYEKLAAAGVRNIGDYNGRVKSGRLKNTDTVTHAKMPYLLVVIDELADLMITAAREVEEPIARLAQLARAVGIHLIVATQRPSVDVITGVIKANFPARIAYQVASKTDSRTILDMNGAEQLLGNGDMLYLASGSPKPVRLQNAYVSPDEVDAVVGHIGKQQGFAKQFMLPASAERKLGGANGGNGDRDPLFEDAARLIVTHQQGSVSLLQRRLKVGYSRAARLVDELEAAGIVGPFDGSKAREVLVQTEDDLERILNV